LQSRLQQLKQLRITQKTLTNPYVVEEYDFATSSLVAEIVALSESNSVLMQNKNLSVLIEKIKVAEQHTPLFRSSYDSIALLFNTFLEKNESSLKEIDKSGPLEKRPLFSGVAGK
jgi:predicted mannosyl-3-phosphoglycerate phosphatase (HAD superfamily)